MNRALTLLLTLLTLSVFGQDNPTEMAKPIVAEGKQLYKSEMASWYGTDLFLKNYKERINIGGYFSYTDNDISKCIFFSKSDNPKVIGTISFDSSYNIKTAKSDLSEREFTTTENDIYAIRKIALYEINSDTLFKKYNNTDLNLIPLINGNEKKVYVLTGPKKKGVVIFGNDYLLTFDKDNKLILKKQLHKNILPIQIEGKEGGEQIGAMHNHLSETGEFVTATDICTLMLYEKFTKWKIHSVVSEKYLNIWNCETDQLTVILNDKVEKINKDQENQKKKIDIEGKGFTGIWQYPNRSVWVEISPENNVYQCRIDKDKSVISSSGKLKGNIITWEKIWGPDTVTRVGDSIFLKGKYGNFQFVKTTKEMIHNCQNPL